jgi:hypothetical protein
VSGVKEVAESRQELFYLNHSWQFLNFPVLQKKAYILNRKKNCLVCGERGLATHCSLRWSHLLWKPSGEACQPKSYCSRWSSRCHLFIYLLSKEGEVKKEWTWITERVGEFSKVTQHFRGRAGDLKTTRSFQFHYSARHGARGFGTKNELNTGSEESLGYRLGSVHCQQCGIVQCLFLIFFFLVVLGFDRISSFCPGWPWTSVLLPLPPE